MAASPRYWQACGNSGQATPSALSPSPPTALSGFHLPPFSSLALVSSPPSQAKTPRPPSTTPLAFTCWLDHLHIPDDSGNAQEQWRPDHSLRLADPHLPLARDWLHGRRHLLDPARRLVWYPDSPGGLVYCAGRRS